MLSVAHGLSGALIASKIPNPLISIPLCIAVHYLEDYVPHWDVGQGLTKKLKSKKAAFLQELFIDFPGSILLVYMFFGVNDYRPWIGWFFALLPDFLEFPYLFLNARFFPIKQLADFHTFVHRSTPDKVKGLIPQILVILMVYYLR